MLYRKGYMNHYTGLEEDFAVKLASALYQQGRCRKTDLNHHIIYRREFEMDYRKLPHGEEEISVIGLGTSSIGAAGDKEIEAVMTLALEKGINYFDQALC